MKTSISYPLIILEKGVLLLSQDKKFRVFTLKIRESAKISALLAAEKKYRFSRRARLSR